MAKNTDTAEQEVADATEKIVLDVLEIMEEVDEVAKTVMAGQRRLNQLYKELERAHKREVRAARKNRRSSNKSGEKKDPSGFNKPQAVPIEFHEQPWGCTPDQELPRTVLTKMVYDYIKEHGLQTEEDKRVINPDPTLRKLFHLKDSDTLEFRNFQTYMARLYKRNFDDDDDVDDESSVSGVSASESESEVEKPKKTTKGGKKTSNRVKKGGKKSKSATSSI